MTVLDINQGKCMSNKSFVLAASASVMGAIAVEISLIFLTPATDPSPGRSLLEFMAAGMSAGFAIFLSIMAIREGKR